jgi:hypothetical protein
MPRTAWRACLRSLQRHVPAAAAVFRSEVMGNDPVGQNYWIVANGIRLMGMPGYPPVLNDQQLLAGGLASCRTGALPPRRNAISLP